MILIFVLEPNDKLNIIDRDIIKLIQMVKLFNHIVACQKGARSDCG